MTIIGAALQKLSQIAEHDWLPTIGAIIISSIAGFFSLRKNRPKEKGDQFKMFMDESAEFREEMRKERESLKVEVEALILEKSALRKKLSDYEGQIESCSKSLKKYLAEVEECHKEIDNLKLKMNTLKERLVRLDEQE